MYQNMGIIIGRLFDPLITDPLLFEIFEFGIIYTVIHGRIIYVVLRIIYTLRIYEYSRIRIRRTPKKLLHTNRSTSYPKILPIQLV